ncbi:PQQ-dependent sugar dehydrogenase, partial [archaeon]|nr:PQQ-dependent sugar dehydrogenase [archaeon]
PDGYLYITVGDAGKSDLAQNIDSLAGKILRLSDDGSIPLDNPFGNAVYSYGHRNPQGLAWDDKDQLWSTEHGPFGFDELNLIKKGKNYGWPIIKGDETKVGMESPIVHSGPNETWAPAGMAYLDGSLFFGGLRGESLYEAKILSQNKISLKSHFRLNFGRIREVVLGYDDYLYISTSNTDKRGNPNPNDDKIIRINPEIFKD